MSAHGHHRYVSSDRRVREDRRFPGSVAWPVHSIGWPPSYRLLTLLDAR